VLSSKVHALGSNRAEFEQLIMDSLRPNELLELPDSRGVFGCGGGPDEFHVRLHGPIPYLQYLNRQPVDWGRWRVESALIGRASYLSSPTRSNWSRYIESGLSVSGNVRVFSNPVPELRLDVREEKNIDVLFLGRLERLKGLDLFLKMVDRLPSGLRVVVAGVAESDMPAEVLAHLAGRVSFHGLADDVVKFRLLQRTKVCVVPSRFESFSMVAAEAISCGCHVVAWRCGGLPEAFPVELVRVVEAFDVDQMAVEVLEFLGGVRYEVESAVDFIRAANLQYANSIKDILSKSSISLSVVSGVADSEMYDRIYDRSARLSPLARFRRKCLKFLRNPVRFVIDFFGKHI
jgi:glycosyltransferase involved in cell wall biosynthesis